MPAIPQAMPNGSEGWAPQKRCPEGYVLMRKCISNKETSTSMNVEK